MTMMTPLVLTTATLLVTLRLAGAQITDTGGRDLTPLAVTETSAENVTVKRGDKKFGDRCEDTLECSFEGSICDKEKKSTCQCIPEMPVTNHIDKCGKVATVNESCFFNEQCEAASFQTECRDGHCVCRFEMIAITKKDGVIECVAQKEEPVSTQHFDPAMIGVLVGMALMFIILCVVLRLFSKARWRENRTIFNTPNPRLMNVSLLRDSKLLHGPERRGSRASVRGPSRQPSMASLRPTSPQSPGKLGSRRGSRTSSASHTSTKSQKSPTKAVTANNTADGAVPNHTESVTVEIQEPKA